MDEAKLELMKGILRSGKDVAGTLGSSLLAEPVAGLGGLWELAKTHDLDKSVARIEALRNKLTYEPTSEEGRESLGMIAKPFEMLEENVVKPVADIAAKVDPALGAATMAGAAIADPLKGRGKAAGRAAKVAAANKAPAGGYEAGLAQLKAEVDADNAAKAARIDDFAAKERAELDAFALRRANELEVQQRAPDYGARMDQLAAMKAELKQEMLRNQAKRPKSYSQAGPDNLINAQRMNPQMTVPKRSASGDWGGPPEGGLFQWSDPGHREFIAETLGNLPDQSLQSPAIRQEMARLNAMAPKDIGGLGLGPQHAPLDRAKAMGFDTPAYHGSFHSDIKKFDPTRSEVGYTGPGVYMSNNPIDSSTYASPYGGDVQIKLGGNLEHKFGMLENDLARNKELDPTGPATKQLEQEIADLNAAHDNWFKKKLQPDANDLEKVLKAAEMGDSLGTVYPLMIRKGSTIDTSPDVGAASYFSENVIDDTIGDMPNKFDATGSRIGKMTQEEKIANFNKMYLNPGELMDDFNLPMPETFVHKAEFGFPHEKPSDRHYVAQDARNIRSKFAAFDPAQYWSDDMMAGMAGLGLTAAMVKALRDQQGESDATY